MVPVAAPGAHLMSTRLGAMGCALGYLDFRHADRNWRQGRNSLTDWYAKFSQTESMKATEPSA